VNFVCVKQLGVEFGSKLITLPEVNKVVKLQCWDTAGQESFRAITRSYYRGAAGCLLVYDVTSRKSFQNVRNWLADVREHADPHVSCILVGNKVDLCSDDATSTASGTVPTSGSPPKASTIKHAKSGSSPSKAATRKAREVPYEEAEQWAKEEGLLFVEASAKSGLNVEQAFIEASRDILEKITKGVFDDDRSPGVKLNPSTKLTLEGGSAKGSCC